MKKDKTPNSSQIMEALGFEYRGSYETSLDDDANYSYTQEYGSNNVMVLSGFDFSFEMSNYTNIDEPKPVKIDNKTYNLITESKDYGFDLKINNIELYNINGQLISAYLYSKNLELGILNQGQYFLKFQCKTGNIYKSLIVK